MHNLEKYLNPLKIVKSIYFNRISSLYFSIKKLSKWKNGVSKIERKIEFSIGSIISTNNFHLTKGFFFTFLSWLFEYNCLCPVYSATKIIGGRVCRVVRSCVNHIRHHFEGNELRNKVELKGASLLFYLIFFTSLFLLNIILNLRNSKFSQNSQKLLNSLFVYFFFSFFSKG